MDYNEIAGIAAVLACVIAVMGLLIWAIEKKRSDSRQVQSDPIVEQTIQKLTAPQRKIHSVTEYIGDKLHKQWPLTPDVIGIYCLILARNLARLYLSAATTVARHDSRRLFPNHRRWSGTRQLKPHLIICSEVRPPYHFKYESLKVLMAEAYAVTEELESIGKRRWPDGEQ